MMETVRSLDEVLADLLAAHQRAPDPRSVRIIEIVRAEIQYREMIQANPPGARWKIAPRSADLL